MGKLSLSLVALGVAACGNDAATPMDGHVVVVPDAPAQMDAKVFNDAPPVNYDFSCFGLPAPTTAGESDHDLGDDRRRYVQAQMPIGVASSTSGFYKVGDANSLDTVTSDTNGLFTSGSIVTGGTPLDGYLRGEDAYRTTYLYPANPLTSNSGHWLRCRSCPR